MIATQHSAVVLTGGDLSLVLCHWFFVILGNATKAKSAVLKLRCFASWPTASFNVAWGNAPGILRAVKELSTNQKKNARSPPSGRAFLRFLSSHVLFGNDLRRIRHSSCFTGSRRRTNIDFWFLCSPAFPVAMQNYPGVDAKKRLLESSSISAKLKPASASPCATTIGPIMPLAISAGLAAEPACSRPSFTPAGCTCSTS